MIRNHSLLLIPVRLEKCLVLFIANLKQWILAEVDVWMQKNVKLLSIENLVTKGHQLINNVIVSCDGKAPLKSNESISKCCDGLTNYGGEMQTINLWF